MRLALQGLFLTSTLFSSIQSSYEGITNDFTVKSTNAEKIKETWAELGLPFLSENEKDLKKQCINWLTNEENLNKLLQKIRMQILEGGLDSSTEILLMIRSLEGAISKWNNLHSYKADSIKSSIIHGLSENFCCRIRIRAEEDINENNVVEYIKDLRIEEKAHKDAAFELVLQATGEAMGAGISAAGGAEPFAFLQGCQSSRHFVKSCEEYCEGVRYQEEADRLQERYINNSSESEEKQWWEFWK